MTSEINVRLTARDEITPVIAAIKAKIGNLGFTQVPGSMGLVGESLFGAAGVGAISAAFSAIQTAAYGTFMAIQRIASDTGRAISDAARIQTLSLAQAGDLASQLGIPFDKAKALVAETRAAIVHMAATLPGETRDFAEIFSQISASVAKSARGDIQKFKDDILTLTRAYGVLAVIRGADTATGGSTINRLIAGTMTLGEAFSTNDITQKNPLLRDYIQQQLEIIGKSEKDWRSLTQETRQRILVAAGKQAVSQEVLASFEGTVDSMIASFKSFLFDPDIGIFGFLRPLEEFSGRNALDYVQAALQSLSNLIKAIGQFVKLPDPMVVFVRATDWFTRVINAITGLIYGGSWDEIDKVFSEIPKTINKLIEDFDKYLEKVDWEKVGEHLGKLITMLLNKIFSINYWGLAKNIFNLFMGLIKVQISAIWQILKDAISGVTFKGFWGSQPAAFRTQPAAFSEPRVQLAAFSEPRVPPNNLTMPRISNNTRNTYAFSPTIHLQASSSNPDEIANLVVNRLDRMFRDYQAAYLT